VRASRLPLLTKCSGSAYLPVDDEQTVNAARAAEWGKLVHRWKETGEVSGSTKRNRTALEKAIFESGVDRELLWPVDGVHETAVALRVDGIREVSREDTPNPGWITGHEDFHWFFLDGTLWVDDLKTGKVYPDPETGVNRYPQDVESAQLKFYALAIATLLGYTGRVCVSLTHWPRLPLEFRHSEPVRYWTEYTHEELQQFWTKLEELYAEVEEGNKGAFVLNPGDHCRFCPSRNYCLEAESFEYRKEY